MKFGIYCGLALSTTELCKKCKVKTNERCKVVKYRIWKINALQIDVPLHFC
jgi:hypothetical protein